MTTLFEPENHTLAAGKVHSGVTVHSKIATQVSEGSTLDFFFNLFLRFIWPIINDWTHTSFSQRTSKSNLTLSRNVFQQMAMKHAATILVVCKEMQGLLKQKVK